MFRNMISDFLDRKLSKRFHAYDVNGDGVIERGDFALAVERMGQAFGREPDDPEMQRVAELNFAVWDRLVAHCDANSDGKVSEEEFKEASLSGSLETVDSFEEDYLPLINAALDIADADRDGKLTATEFTLWAGSLLNHSQPEIDEILRHFDRDDDGLISREVVLASIREYFFNDSPDSAGSWVVDPSPGQ
ncbi:MULTISPECIES: EF-hand domain-containing protein [Nocardia]|uniref:EF-hand domain-containing protein n=2 Tax=Nocardiaceae TaxID=85025 RepID=UPI001357BCE6|nr:MULTISPECIES: EF-hand domain-containing protein [Nocardia]